MGRTSSAWQDLAFHDITTADFLDPNQLWRKVIYKGYSYFISNHGNVYSMVKGKYLIQNLRTVHTQKYGQYSFKGQWFSTHRMVLLAFGPPQPSLEHEVNHKDKDGSNNHISNLEWMLHSENLKHSFDNGRKKVSGADHWRTGNNHSEETRKIMSEKKKAYWERRRAHKSPSFI